jgi:hypothetical protein
MPPRLSSMALWATEGNEPRRPSVERASRPAKPSAARLLISSVHRIGSRLAGFALRGQAQARRPGQEARDTVSYASHVNFQPRTGRVFNRALRPRSQNRNGLRPRL